MRPPSRKNRGKKTTITTSKSYMEQPMEEDASIDHTHVLQAMEKPIEDDNMDTSIDHTPVLQAIGEDGDTTQSPVLQAVQERLGEVADTRSDNLGVVYIRHEDDPVLRDHSPKNRKRRYVKYSDDDESEEEGSQHSNVIIPITRPEKKSRNTIAESPLRRSRGGRISDIERLRNYLESWVQSEEKPNKSVVELFIALDGNWEMIQQVRKLLTPREKKDKQTKVMELVEKLLNQKQPKYGDAVKEALIVFQESVMSPSMELSRTTPVAHAKKDDTLTCRQRSSASHSSSSSIEVHQEMSALEQMKQWLSNADGGKPYLPTAKVTVTQIELGVQRNPDFVPNEQVPRSSPNPLRGRWSSSV